MPHQLLADPDALVGELNAALLERFRCAQEEGDFNRFRRFHDSGTFPNVPLTEDDERCPRCDAVMDDEARCSNCGGHAE